MENPLPIAVPESELQERRERVFLILAGVFICSMTMLNIIGSTRFIALGPLTLTVGVLPYPLTFLCTDLICELYGKKRANFLVTLGLCLNLFIFAVIYLAHWAPGVPEAVMPPWQNMEIVGEMTLPNNHVASGHVELFDFIYALTSGAIFASMLAYTAAQYIDVRLFHFWKTVTKGKHLWVRNNFSTMISQAVDSVVVIGVVFAPTYFAGGITLEQWVGIMISSYLFKLVAALLDTGPFYFLTAKLRRYLKITA
ncbi:queuosine precursor transporter [Sessilibacter sp. MAH2]